MYDTLLTFYCATGEADGVAQSLRGCTEAPIHVRDETVHGRDFSDAQIAEQVTGRLRRAAVEVATHKGAVETLVAAVSAARRAHPVRWHAVPLIAQGRIA